MKQLYNYQSRTVTSACKLLRQGEKVCIASAVGSGKTLMGAAIVRRMKQTTLWVAHRRELIEQAAQVLREVTGKTVGIVMPGYPRTMADIQVTTIQTMLNVDFLWFKPQLLVLDETHHYEADHWTTVKKLSSSKQILGLTATPERSDGRPLGDTFSKLVVGAQYEELEQSGVLVPWTVYQPKDPSYDWALDPVAAYQQLGSGKKALAYYQRIKLAEAGAETFRQAGIYSECISSYTRRKHRKEYVRGLNLFGDDRIDVMTNVDVLTEGIDIPNVSVIILARSFQFAGGYIQATGRAARAAEGKTHAVLIDLVGSSLLHGPPDQNWQYSLDYGIKRPEPSEEDTERQKRTPAAFVEPVVEGSGIFLSLDSSFIPEQIPTQCLPPSDPRKRNNPQHYHDVREKLLSKTSGPIASFVASLTSGMRE